MRSNGVVCRRHRSTGVFAGSSGVGGTGLRITVGDEAFDVDVRCARAQMDGDQNLEQISASRGLSERVREGK